MDIWLTPWCGPPHGKPDADRVCQIGLFSRGFAAARVVLVSLFETTVSLG